MRKFARRYVITWGAYPLRCSTCGKWRSINEIVGAGDASLLCEACFRAAERRAAP